MNLILEPEKFIGKERPDMETVVEFYCSLCGKKCWHLIKQPVSNCFDENCGCAGHMAEVEYAECYGCGYQLYDESKSGGSIGHLEGKELEWQCAEEAKWRELREKCKKDLQKRVFQKFSRGKCDDCFNPNEELDNNQWVLCKYIRNERGN